MSSDLGDKPQACSVESSDSKWLWDVDSKEDFIACIVEATATIRQQPGIFECSRIVVGFLLRLVAVHLNIALNWYKIQFIFQNTLVVLLDFQP